MEATPLKLIYSKGYYLPNILVQNSSNLILFQLERKKRGNLGPVQVDIAIDSVPNIRAHSWVIEMSHQEDLLFSVLQSVYDIFVIGELRDFELRRPHKQGHIGDAIVKTFWMQSKLSYSDSKNLSCVSQFQNMTCLQFVLRKQGQGSADTRFLQYTKEGGLFPETLKVWFPAKYEDVHQRRKPKAVTWNKASEICKSVGTTLPYFCSRDHLNELLATIMSTKQQFEIIAIGLKRKKPEQVCKNTHFLRLSSKGLSGPFSQNSGHKIPNCGI